MSCSPSPRRSCCPMRSPPPPDVKRARSALIMHDLYPDVLVMAGNLKASSLVAAADTRRQRADVSRCSSAVIIIGRDTEALLLRYKGLTRATGSCFIPNWATLTPGVRPIDPDNPYRRFRQARFVVGLSGNLGFHPRSGRRVRRRAAAARQSRHSFHAVGMGDRFRSLEGDAIERQASQCQPGRPGAGSRISKQFLAAADIWLIPYRKDVAGVSVPSRFYNLLAIGRPVLLVSEANAEAALTVSEHGLGWVVEPGKPDDLAHSHKAGSFAPRSVGGRTRRCDSRSASVSPRRWRLTPN